MFSLAHPFCDHSLIPPKFVRRRPCPCFRLSIPLPVVLATPRPQRQSAPAPSAPPAPQLVEPELQLPADAPRSILHQQWHGNNLPLGMGANGLLVADPKAYLHLLMAGTSGSGKTRFGLRPLITSALASGLWLAGSHLRPFWAGFSAFPAASEAHTVLLEDRSCTVDHFLLLYEMTQGRFVTLYEAGVSTWG